MMKRVDYYLGIGLFAGLLLIGNYSLECVKAQNPASSLRVLQVQELDIVDKAGKIKAVFCVNADGKPELDLFSGGKQSILSSRILSDSILMTTSKKSGVVISSEPFPQVGLFGTQSKVHAALSLDHHDRASLLLLDKEGLVTTSLPPQKGDPLYTP